MSLAPENITQKKILIAALDWGMGHTTRCSALIKILLAQKNTLVFAGNEHQKAFIVREFPEIKCVDLPGYAITLNSKKSTYLQLLFQFGKLRKALKVESAIAESLVNDEKFDLIISDNRYGFRATDTINILLTHQLNLQIPAFRKVVNKRLRKWINQFDMVWVPDRKERPVCGDLIKSDLQAPVHFIGFLSRFTPEEKPIRYDIVGTLSGPEPERSRFAQLLTTYLLKQNKRVALVGTTGNFPEIDYYPNPTTGELSDLLNSSALVVSRCGYTTLMELISMNKKALLIPTPGQYEQEYLASIIHAEGIDFINEPDFLKLNAQA